MTPVFTIGHSTLSYEEFLARLRTHAISAVADVRSSPYSRHLPHFNREQLREQLKSDGISYVFLGEELGGRPTGSENYRAGVADYEAMATRASFKEGVTRVVEGTKKFTVALMCSEQDPLDCHRCLLVGRALKRENVSVSHIMPLGSVKSHEDIERQLLNITGNQNADFFSEPKDRLDAAYRERAMKVAYSTNAADGFERNARRKKVG